MDEVDVLFVGYADDRVAGTVPHRSAEGAELSTNVRPMSTPSHTAQDITTLAETADGVVALTHLWWDESSESDPLAQDLDALLANRKRVLDVASLIIPGHGAPFRPTR